MGAASMRRPHATLRKALNDAVTKAKLIPTNPALGVALEPAKRHKARVWTAKATRRWQATGKRSSPVMVRMPGQAGQFLDHAQAHDITRALSTVGVDDAAATPGTCSATGGTDPGGRISTSRQQP